MAFKLVILLGEFLQGFEFGNPSIFEHQSSLDLGNIFADLSNNYSTELPTDMFSNRVAREVADKMKRIGNDLFLFQGSTRED